MKKLILSLLVVLFLISCGKESQVGKGKIIFKFNKSGEKYFDLVASTNADLDCYGIFVDSPLVGNNTSCVDIEGQTVFSADDVLGSVGVGSILSAELDPANGYVFYLVGFKSNIACPDLSGDISAYATDLSGPHLIASSSSVEIVEGDNDVFMTADMATGTALRTCIGGATGWSIQDRPLAGFTYPSLHPVWVESMANPDLYPSVDGDVDTFVATNLPPGVTIDSSTGILSGIPTATSTGIASITAINFLNHVDINLHWTVIGSASVFVVDSTDDNADLSNDGSCADVGGDCTLRAAIEELSDGSPAGTPIFVPEGTYTLTSDLAQSGSGYGLEIHGQGPDVTIIDGNSFYKAFHFSGGANSKTSISNLTVKNTYSYSGSGAAIFLGNSRPDDSVKDCILEDNVSDGATAAENGGAAIYINHGGGETITVSNCKFLNNLAVGNGATGGAIFVKQGDLFVENSYFYGNSAEDGGAISTATSSNGFIQVASSTFAYNTASETTAFAGGGAILVDNTHSIQTENSTFYANDSGWHGGAIYIKGSGARTHSLKSSTFAFNTSTGSVASGGALYVDHFQTISFHNNIFSNNTSLSTDDHCHNQGNGTITSYGGNIFESIDAVTDGCLTSLVSQDLDSVVVDTVLGSFDDTFGIVPTIPLLDSSSPAFGNGLGTCSLQDARGIPRSAAACDSGAVEYRP